MVASSLAKIGSDLPAFSPQVYNVDVFICGGTMGGIFAGIAAAKAGKTVYITEQHPYHIGGMQTGGLSLADTPTSPTSFWPLCLDFYTRCAARYGYTVDQFNGVVPLQLPNHCNGEPHVFLEVLNEMMAEDGVTVNCGQRVERVAKSGLYITSVVLTDGTVVHAKRFIDSSYEGDLMQRSGCTYTWGRESSSQYGESAAGGTVPVDIAPGFPIDPYVTAGNAASGLLPGVSSIITAVGASDKLVMGYNYRLCMTRSAGKILPPEPDAGTYNAQDYEYLGRLAAAGAIASVGAIFTSQPLLGGKFDWNANGAIGTNLFNENHNYPFADYGARDLFWARLKNYTLGLFKFIREDSRISSAVKNAVSAFGFAPDEFKRDGGMSPYVYVREAARLVGDFVMTQPLLSDAGLLDIMAYSAYTIDSHYVTLVNSAGVLKAEGKTSVTIGYFYPVPYRALQPKQSDCKNLLVTFACSLSHVVFSSERMEYVHMGVGESAGYAASLSIDQNEDYSNLDVTYIQNAAGLNPTGVLMDPAGTSNAGMGTITLVGAWTTALNTAGKSVWGQNFIHDGAAGKGTKTVRYTPILPAAGSYEIWVKFKDQNDALRANNVPYTVQRSGGTSTGTYDQKLPGPGVNNFLSIGTFTLVGDGTDYFEMGNTGTAGGTNVIADAVVFQPKFTIIPLKTALPSTDIQFVDVTVPTASVLTLNATPYQLVPAPGFGYSLIFLGALFTKAAGTAYAGILAGEDLAVRYTNASGAIVAEAEPTGFLDQATAQILYAYPFVAGATSPVFSVAPVTNSPLMLHMLVGEVITGTSDLRVRVWYRGVPSAL